MCEHSLSVAQEQSPEHSNHIYVLLCGKKNRDQGSHAECAEGMQGKTKVRRESEKQSIRENSYAA